MTFKSQLNTTKIMNINLLEQKIRLEIALNWISMIENCDIAIEANHPNSNWFAEKKKTYEAEYKKEMDFILEHHIILDNLLKA